MTDTHTGPHGTAERIPDNVIVPADIPTATRSGWLITAPGYHPLWSQYALWLITLADVPGVPPAVKHDDAATHEIMVLPLDPENGPHPIEALGSTFIEYVGRGNIAQQFTADSDEHAAHAAELCARAVTDGLLNPETGDAPDRIRAAWKYTIAATLDHPHHA